MKAKERKELKVRVEKMGLLLTWPCWHKGWDAICAKEIDRERRRVKAQGKAKP
jgi:hypothetical protein